MGSFRLIEKHLSFQKKQAFRCLLFIWEIWGRERVCTKAGGFRRLSTRSGSGPGPGRCFPVFPKGPAPAAQRGLWHPSGLWPSVPRVVEKGCIPQGKRLTTFCASLRSFKMCSLCIASLRGPPIGGQDRDGESYRRYAPYTLSRFAGLRPGGKHVTGFSGRFALLQIQFLCHLKGKRENRWHWILCHI